MRRRHLGLVLFVAVFKFLTVLVTGGSGRFRELLTTPWLGDWWRPAAVLTIAGALVVALALGELSSILLRPGASGSPSRGQVGLAVLLVLPLTVALVWQLPSARDELAAVYGPLARSRAPRP